jgi:hypothetical protein
MRLFLASHSRHAMVRSSARRHTSLTNMWIIMTLSRVSKSALGCSGPRVDNQVTFNGR